MELQEIPWMDNTPWKLTGVNVDPERDPGQDDDKDARHVDLDHEVADVPSETEPDFQARICTCKFSNTYTLINFQQKA